MTIASLARRAALCCCAISLACSGGSRPGQVDAGPGADGGPGDARDTAGRWLYVSSLGVAFSAFPGRKVVTRTLAVRSAHGPELAWTAEADQGWLTVTAGGTTGGDLVLTANPAGLVADRAYAATVRVTSPDPSVRNQQVVRVGLWVGSADPGPVTLAVSAPFLVADPVMPYLYTSARGGDITVYDVYTGAVVRSFPAVVTGAGSMAISSDGALLFVNDVANRRVVALDTATGGERHRYLWASLISSGLGYARPNGHPILVIGNGKVFDVETAAIEAFGLIAGTEDASFAIDRDARYAYALEHGVEPAEFRQFALDYDPRAAKPLLVQGRRSNRDGVFGQAICAAADGSQVYVARSEASTPAFRADDLMKIQTLPGGGVNAECGWNGLFFAGDGRTVSVYRLDGAPAGTLTVPAEAGTLVLSGDNTRIAGSINPFQGTPSFTIRSAPSP